MISEVIFPISYYWLRNSSHPANEFRIRASFVNVWFFSASLRKTSKQEKKNPKKEKKK